MNESVGPGTETPRWHSGDELVVLTAEVTIEQMTQAPDLHQDKTERTHIHHINLGALPNLGLDRRVCTLLIRNATDGRHILRVTFRTIACYIHHHLRCEGRPSPLLSDRSASRHTPTPTDGRKCYCYAHKLASVSRSARIGRDDDRTPRAT